jgi:hypothetical protein
MGLYGVRSSQLLKAINHVQTFKWIDLDSQELVTKFDTTDFSFDYDIDSDGFVTKIRWNVNEVNEVTEEPIYEFPRHEYLIEYNK